MTTATLTLTSFLIARIAEDEADARNWAALGGAGEVESLERRVLAECAAKRAIVEACEDARQRKDIYNRDYDAGLLTRPDDLRSRLDANVRWRALDDALRMLAEVYGDHPEHGSWVLTF